MTTHFPKTQLDRIDAFRSLLTAKDALTPSGGALPDFPLAIAPGISVENITLIDGTDAYTLMQDGYGGVIEVETAKAATPVSPEPAPAAGSNG